MGDKSKIEWCDATWNPIRGCSLVSSGCQHCYAMGVAHRNPHYRGLTRMTEHGPVWTGEVRLVPELLDQPLRWKRPHRIFVNSMSDIFHGQVPDGFIDQIFAVMALAPQHVFQVLTKRPERMRGYVTAEFVSNRVLRAMQQLTPKAGAWSWPTWKDAMKNVWLGISCEDQKTANERIPLLLQTPAAVRWVSAEPLLEGVNLDMWMPIAARGNGWVQVKWEAAYGEPKKPRIDWLIVGGESGPRARPMHPGWARSIRDQCQAAGVPFFFKQWGEWSRDNAGSERLGSVDLDGNWTDGLPYGWGLNRRSPVQLWRVGKKAAGRLLDGREWNEYPTD